MIGWVPHVIGHFLNSVGGDGLRRAVMLEAGFDPDSAFRLNEGYDDTSCRRILDVAAARLGLTEAEVFEAFAPFFLDQAHGSFSAFLTPGDSLRAVLLAQPHVHDTLSAGLNAEERAQVTSKFMVVPTTSGVRVLYRSANRLAGLYAAIARRLGERFGETVFVRFTAGGPEDAECIMDLDIKPCRGRLDLAA